MSRRQRALRALRFLQKAEWSLRYSRVNGIGKRAKWYCWQLGKEDPLCRTPEQAIEAVMGR